MFGLFSGGSFGRYGTGWIVLKAFYYGVVGLMLFFCFALYAEQNRAYLVTITVLILLLVADSKLTEGSFDRTLFDRLCSSVGYGIFLLLPHRIVDDPLPADCRGGIPPRTTLEVNTDAGPISITSGSGLLRTIVWHGQKRSISLERAPFSPSHDLWSPSSRSGERWPGHDWKYVSGITRCAYVEGVRRFDSREEALQYIERIRDRDSSMRCSEDGLMLSVLEFAEPETIHIGLFQILVDDEKLSDLPQTAKMLLRSAGVDDGG